MEHPASILKTYLMGLDERIARLDAKLDEGLQNLGAQITKLDSSAQNTNKTVAKLNSDLDESMQMITEVVNEVDQKVDNSARTTNEAIGGLYKEKLSIQEFREFVNLFTEILRDGFQITEEPAAQISVTPARESSVGDYSNSPCATASVLLQESDEPQNNELASSFEVADEGPSQIVINNFASETGVTTQLLGVVENTAPPLKVADRVLISKHIGFPMNVTGESFYAGDGVTSVVGDVEIPPGTTVDETLVVKGNFKSRECCRLLRDVKAFKDIEIGIDTTVEGNLISGGKVTVGSDSVIKGAIESDGDIEIGKNVIVKENLSSKSTIALDKSAQIFQAVNAAKGVFKT